MKRVTHFQKTLLIALLALLIVDLLLINVYIKKSQHGSYAAQEQRNP